MSLPPALSPRAAWCLWFWTAPLPLTSASTGVSILSPLCGVMCMSVCPREEGAVEVIRYSSIGGVPQSVTGMDLGVDNPLEVRGEVSDEGDPTPTTDETDVTSYGEDRVNARCWVYHSLSPLIFSLFLPLPHPHPHTYTVPHAHTKASHTLYPDTSVTSSPPSATPTSDPTTEPSSSTSDLTGEPTTSVWSPVTSHQIMVLQVCCSGSYQPEWVWQFWLSVSCLLDSVSAADNPPVSSSLSNILSLSLSNTLYCLHNTLLSRYVLFDSPHRAPNEATQYSTTRTPCPPLPCLPSIFP